MQDADTDIEIEGSRYIARTPPQLRRLLRQLRVKPARKNYVALVFESIRIVNSYASSAPLWLRRELCISLLNEIDELDGMESMFANSISTMIDIADSGSFSEIRSSRGSLCPCGFCCCG